MGDLFRPSYEVVVIGAGPAGACAARETARRGRTTLMVEAKEHLGERCHCAEWVPALLTRRVEIGSGVRRGGHRELEVRAGGLTLSSQVNGFVIERKIWEKNLALEAARAGASVVAGVRFRGFGSTGALILQTPEGQTEVRAGAVIAADGGLSKVASAAGMDRAEGVPAINIEVDAGPELNSGLTIFYPGLFGYCWLFPKGPSANLGLGGEILKGPGLSARLADLRRELIDQGLIGPSIFRRAGGFIPVTGPRPELTIDLEGRPVFLTGDAAGLTHPLTGAGIPQAVESGLEAGAKAADYLSGNPDSLQDYQDSIMSLYRGYLSRAVKKRATARAIWESDFIQAVRTYWPLWPGKKA